VSEKKVPIPLEGSEIPIISEAYLKGKVDPKEMVELCVCLRYKPSSSGLLSLKEMCCIPLSQRKYLSHEEFEKGYGADPADMEKVKALARKHMLSWVGYNTAQRIVFLKGTVKAVEDAFSVELYMYQHKGIMFRGHQGSLHIPNELKGIVIGVFGLSNPFATTPNKKGPYFPKEWPTALTKADIAPPRMPFFFPPDLAQVYNFPADTSGKGQTIGLIQLGGGYIPEYLDEYFGYLELNTPSITPISVCGGFNNPGKDGKSDLEVCGDIEVVGGMANSADQVVYFAPDNEAGFLCAVKAAVHDNTHKNTVISISWGNRESNYSHSFKEIMNETLQEAANLGITVCVATGDMGSYDGSPPSPQPGSLPKEIPAYVDFPAASPWVLACGGTKLEVGKERIEVAWNDGMIIGATGGGVSEHFNHWPPYQEENEIRPISVNPPHNHGRGIPDVAGNASPITGYILKINYCPFGFYGGTSAVAPLWAALIARLNEKLNMQLGFINPILYQYKKSNICNDIIKGHNKLSENFLGYDCKIGWDACTGLGTPNGENLYNAIHGMLQKEKG
jgi:kumamolisin